MYNQTTDITTMLFEPPTSDDHNPETIYIKKELNEYLSRVVEELSQQVIPRCEAARTAKIIRFMLGLDKDTEPMSLEETAKEFGLTRQRIKQISVKLIRLLRQPPYCEVLIDYVKGE